jgi:hypothetical protein
MSNINLLKRKWQETADGSKSDEYECIGECQCKLELVEENDSSVPKELPTKPQKTLSALAASCALLREPFHPLNLVFLDAKTGRAARIDETCVSLYKAAPFNCSKVTAVLYTMVDGVDEAIKAKTETMSDECLAQFAAAVLMYNVRYDYIKGEWFVRLPKRQGEGPDATGHFVRDTLLPGIVANVLLSNQENGNPEQDQEVLRATASLLKSSATLRQRIMHRMEWLMMWHVLPPSADLGGGEQRKWIVADWLVQVFGRKLVRRSSFDFPSPPALVSDLWIDFSSFLHKKDERGINKEQFGLIVADWLGEWPHKHSWLPNSHFIGYQWRADVPCWQKTPANICKAFDIVALSQRTCLLGSAAAAPALEVFRRQMLMHFDS